MNPLITALLRDGYPLSVIAKKTGIKQRSLSGGDLSEKEYNLLERYAKDQRCCKDLIRS